MSLRARIADRFLALVGLDFDFTPDLRRKAFSPITETLFVGCRPRPGDAVALREAGVTHVVSCLPDAERASVSFLSADFGCLYLPVRDSIHEDIASAFPAVFDFAAAAQRDDAQAKLLVHCEAGVSRSASVAIALLMQAENASFFDTFMRARERRAEVLPNIGFASQLQHLEHTLCPESRKSGEPSSLARYLRQVCNVPLEVEALQEALERHHYDAPQAIRSVFGGDIPRVVQGVRV